jgi:hypothetical protein
MKFWGIKCYDQFSKHAVSKQSEKTKQDTDDGKMFFHTHSVWEAVQKLEKFYECKIYGVLELQDVENNLELWGDYHNVSKKALLEAMEYANEEVECYEYEVYIETIAKYLQATEQGGQHASKI